MPTAATPRYIASVLLSAPWKALTLQFPPLRRPDEKPLGSNGRLCGKDVSTSIGNFHPQRNHGIGTPEACFAHFLAEAPDGGGGPAGGRGRAGPNQLPS